MKTPYDLAYDYAMHTGRCIFLTGKAGTGKTTLLRRLKAECKKQIIVTAPTGVAAINAEGVTLHSLFQLPPQVFLPTDQARKHLFAEMQMREQKRRILRSMELLVIDEISMVRADLLDAIDAVLRHVKHQHNLPFGGTQVLFIGDLYQLSPVAREEDWQLLRDYYAGPYFFQATVFSELRPVYIELNQVFRQQDSRFVDILNQVRTNTLTEASLALLNDRCVTADGVSLSDTILLTTHNRKADAVNTREMNALKGREYTFRPEVNGTFPESAYPMEAELRLREGARVMFLRNDSAPEKLYYNGKIGEVTKLGLDRIVVQCEGEDPIEVHRETWENIRYTPDDSSDEVHPEIIGTFTHYPLRLAWAVTVHKAQGLTFDRVVIDAEEAFAAGQVYVALSRCRTLEGITLLSKIPQRALMNALDVVRYTANQPDMSEVESSLSGSEYEYLVQILCCTFDFRDTVSKWETIRRFVSQSGSFNMSEMKDYSTSVMDELSEWQHIGESFQRQVQHIMLSSDKDTAFLSARLKAAAGYYEQRLLPLAEKLKQSPAKSEEKDDIRTYMELLMEVHTDVLRRLHIMKGLWQQPSVSQYFALRQSFRLPVVKKNTVPPKTLKAKSARLAKNKEKSSPKVVIPSSVDSDRRVVLSAFRTLWFIQQGKNIKDISKERHLSEKQVTAHIRYLLQEGLMHLSQLSPADRCKIME